MKQNRNISIDILKFFAVLLITNSHFDEQYVYCKELVTGGAIGDALFFFCSGYTLFLGRFGRFDEWYKRRIRRIYPSVLSLGLISVFLFQKDIGIGRLLSDGAGWFVMCIMIYYVALYFVRRYLVHNLRYVYVGVVLLILLWNSLFFEPISSIFVENFKCLDWMIFCQPMDKVWIFQWNYFKFGFFFLYMLIGADLGLRESKRKTQDSPKFLHTFLLLLLSIICFYAIPIICDLYPDTKYVLILSLIPLVYVVLYFYKLCQTDFIRNLLNKKYIGSAVMIIGGLCLEIYLVQPYLRTTDLNHLFPLNIVILSVAIVFVGYVCRSLGRFIQQTFSSEEGYEWKSIFRLIR